MSCDTAMSCVMRGWLQACVDGYKHTWMVTSTRGWPHTYLASLGECWSRKFPGAPESQGPASAGVLSSRGRGPSLTVRPATPDEADETN